MAAQVDITENGITVECPWLKPVIRINQLEYPLKYQGRDITPQLGGLKAIDGYAIIADQNSHECFEFQFGSGILVRLGFKYGSNNVGYTRSGKPVWQNSATTYCVGNEVKTIPSPPTTPSTGFLDIDLEDNPIWTALNYIKVIKGYNFINSYTRGMWTIGLSDNFYGVIAYNTASDKLYKVRESNDTYTIPRINSMGVAAVGLEGYFITPDKFTEIKVEETGKTRKFAYPRPMLFAPYASFGKYGDDDDYPGNAVLTVDTWDTNPDGYPLITSLRARQPHNDDITMAWYLHGGGDNPEVHKKEYENLLALPEKPIIFYIDARETWKNWIPTWVDSDRTWLSFPIYRNVGESLAHFYSKCEAVLDHIQSRGFAQALTLGFYDRNYNLPLEQVLECMPIYDKYIKTYDVAAILPFANMRPSGMKTYPELKQAAWDMFLRIPGRPNRLDYWLGHNWKENLKKKLDYTMLILSPEERNYLKEKLL